MIDEQILKPVMSERLIGLRKRCGVSQKKLAADLRVSRATINRIENGHLLPETPLLYSLADYFDVPTDYFRAVSEESEKKSAIRA